jgi:hypothetical protein
MASKTVIATMVEKGHPLSFEQLQGIEDREWWRWRELEMGLRRPLGATAPVPDPARGISCGQDVEAEHGPT